MNSKTVSVNNFEAPQGNVHAAATALLAVAVVVFAVQSHVQSSELRSSKANADRYKSFAVWLVK